MGWSLPLQPASTCQSRVGQQLLTRNKRDAVALRTKEFDESISGSISHCLKFGKYDADTQAIKNQRDLVWQRSCEMTYVLHACWLIK
jgi:hypothetical protein